jgi:hypothetical protein
MTERYTLTRAQVAATLGVSTSTVKRMEFDSLVPVQDSRGRWCFDPAEVERVRTTRSPRQDASAPRAKAGARRAVDPIGRRAARLFRLFERGRPLPEIVVATREPPAFVRRMFHEWSVSLEHGEWQRAERAARPEGITGKLG